MEHAGIDLSGLSNIPEIFPQIATGSPCHIHFIMVFVAAVRALPFHIIIDDDLAILAAHLAVISLCIKFRILDIFVNIFYKFFQCRKVISQIRDLDIRDRPAR